MWTEIAKGGSVIAMVAIMFRFLQTRIDKKADQSNCDIHVLDFKNLLEKGDEKFDKIMVIAKETGEMVARIDERTKKSNGGI